MSKLQHALDLASRGFWIFPLRENSKLPLIKGYPTRATRDPEAIKDWWVDPVLEIEKDHNIGISTSRFGDDEALIAIDVDNKGAKKGDETLEALDIIGKEVPETFTQFTPTGGRHLVFAHSEALKQGVDTLGSGLDIRSKGGYLVGAGSTINGEEYTFSPAPLAPAPEWLISQLGKPKEKSTAPAPTNINQEAAKDRAIYYLQNEAPESIKGDGGDHTAYKVAAKVKDFGVSETDCLELMLDHWFEGSGWSPERLQEKIAHAYQYGTEVIGADAPEASFTPMEMTEETLGYLEKMNKEFALIYMEGSHFILHETVDEKGAPKRVFLNEASFKRKFSPFSLQKRGTYATEWLDWPKRREYQGVCFAPEREARNGYYNLWRGFTVTPLEYRLGTKEQREGFDAFLDHTRDNICRGDEALFTWLIGYFSHMVQRPFERPLTTLVFRGGKGVGKNAFVDRIGAILGTGHYLVAHDGRYLTSNFNAHFDSCLCLVLDEAFWSGDKSAEGKLKGLTTGPEILIERKGKEPYQIDNLVRLIIIGNEDWLVPASNDERRYAVCDIGDGRKQDTQFFHDMRVRMDVLGGNRILLDYLKKFDLTKVDVNRAPVTQALLDQKISSLEPFPAWWYECLSQGKIVNADYNGEWPETVDTQIFKGAFAKYCKERNIHSRMPSEIATGKKLRVMCKSIGERSKRWQDGGTVWIYKLPLLEDARKEWDQFIGQESLWE